MWYNQYLPNEMTQLLCFWGSLFLWSY